MKKIIFSLLLCASYSVYSQTLVVADGILAGTQFLKSEAKNFKAKKTYAANAVLPTNLNDFSEIKKSSLISINLKENYYDRISLGELNLQHKLDAKNPVLFDGFLIKDTEINILGDVIRKTEIKIVDGNKTLIISSDPKS